MTARAHCYNNPYQARHAGRVGAVPGRPSHLHRRTVVNFSNKTLLSEYVVRSSTVTDEGPENDPHVRVLTFTDHNAARTSGMDVSYQKCGGGRRVIRKRIGGE